MVRISWQDAWMQDVGPLISLVQPTNIHGLGFPSVTDMVSSHGDWRWDVLQELLPRSMLLRLSAMMVPQPWFSEDRLLWAGNVDGHLTIRSTYHIRNGQDTPVSDNTWNVIHSFRVARGMSCGIPLAGDGCSGGVHRKWGG
ncbi:hypothetical protein V6N13_135319 [Hibiscus sabdariffa]